MNRDINKENAILKKLLANYDASSSVQEIEDIKQIARQIARTSSRHHYIPQYFIKGFTGTDGLLHVYNKSTRTIKSGVGTKGVFFENDRNSVEIDNLKVSIIEDDMFSQVDHLLSVAIKELRESNFSENLLRSENQGMVNAFIIDLFWRNPIADSAFEDMFARSVITFKDSNGNTFKDLAREKMLRLDEAHKKMQRAGMAINSLNDILSRRPPGHVFTKLWEFESELFTIGDYPVLFRGIPSKLTDLYLMDFLLPISKTRMYANQKRKMYKFTKEDAMLYNALIIDQSTSIICASNKDILEKSVRYYDELKKSQLLSPFKEVLFHRIAHTL